LQPQRIGKYEVVGKIGQGAMGEVFRAHDPVLNRDVAIKRISGGLDVDEMVRKRFEREAKAAALLMHPNIITVYELGIEGDQLFMAMELLDGVDLKQVLASRRMTLDEKVGAMEQICEGLAYAHAHDIVHRDLKPANIHILPSGKVKIMDFGLARLSGSEMTSTGMVMGTPHYMSPEQVKGAKADARSDVFALGCVLYEMLTGRKPFDAESMHAVLFKIMQEEPAPLREAAPGTPEALVQVVERALAKNPAERFDNASEMLAGIRQAHQAVATGSRYDRATGADRPSRTREPGRPPARERSHASSVPRNTVPPTTTGTGSRWPLLAGVGLALVAVLGGAWALRDYVLGRTTSATTPATVSPLAQRAIDSQVELARRKLDAGEFADAVRQAEGALKLDPRNAAAQEVLDEAAAKLKRIDEAVSAVRAAGRDRARLASAAFDLMRLDPGHPEAETAATAAGAAFRPSADKARQLEQEARRAAEEAGADKTPAFAEGADLESQGQQALASAQPVLAARHFLEARERFERARRIPR
jgi:serine/threonine-protein kinase